MNFSMFLAFSLQLYNWKQNIAKTFVTKEGDFQHKKKQRQI
jgi:hypothetical protein